MKNIKWILILLILGALCVLSLLRNETNVSQFPKKSEQTKENEIDRLLQEMTLEEKIGQMLIIENRVPNMTDALKETLQEVQPGGFILFKENFTDYETTLALVEEIKSTVKIPLFLAIDQEGGRVQRLSYLPNDIITQIPPMYELGKTENEALAYEVGTVVAEELQVFGINVNFAPVVDVLTNQENKVIGNRSFGSIASLVSKMSISFANGLENKGVIAVYKHFPGHGSTKTDSHYDLPVLTKTKEELWDCELIPFQNAIENGANIIMIGHIAIPAIDEENTPASLSKKIITNLLKEEMNYQGLVVTDALNMKAITNYYNEKQIYEKAINAGVDLLLMPNDPKKAITYIKELIEEGKLTKEQIEQSVKKILSLKYGKMSTGTLGRATLGNKEHQQIIEKIQS